MYRFTTWFIPISGFRINGCSLNIVRSYASGPKHDVHYETSLHKDGKGITENAERSLPDSADVVVIGGGSIGCSTAYHAAKLNAKVVLIEKGRLTSGTTWHTAGIHSNIRDCQCLTQMQVQTSDLLKKILPEETGFDAGWIETGSLYVTRNRDQLDGLEKKSLMASECGVKSWMVDVDEIARLHPLLNTKDLIGGMYSPHDGSLDPATLCTSYIKAATKYGAQVFENCEVTDIKTTESTPGLRKVVGVETSMGTIKTNNVVNCTGAWAPYIAKMVGIELPQITYKHSYVITQRIPGIETTPHVRDIERVVYHKRQGDVLLFGGYEKDPDLVGLPEKDFMFGLYDMNWTNFEMIMEGAMDLIPSIADVGIRSTVCGPESFTPDSRPLLGEPPYIKGFFIGSAFNSGGMMMGGGAGRQLAHWVVNGAPEYDTHACDINRFTRKGDKNWVIETCHDSFTTRYEVDGAYKQKLGGRNLRTTPLTEIQIENGAYFNCINGWEVPAYYLTGRRMPLLKYDYFGMYGKKRHQSYAYRDQLARDSSFDLNEEVHAQVTKESLICHDSVGVVDLSHLSKFLISGNQAEDLVQKVFTTDVTATSSGYKTNTLMLNELGKIVAYVSVAKLCDKKYQITAASELQDFILRHVNQFLMDTDIDCKFEDITDQQGILEIVGPNGVKFMETVENQLAEELKCYDAGIYRSPAEFSFYEVQFPMAKALNVYNCLMSSEAKASLVGLRAFTSIFLETGQLSPISKFLAGGTPCEADLLDLCPLDGNREYVGRESIKKTLNDPRKAALVRLESKSDIPVFANDLIWRNGAYAGTIQEAVYGSKTGKYHIIGYLKIPPSQILPDDFTTSGDFTVGRCSNKVKAELASHKN